MTLRIAEWGMGAWLPFAARARKCAPLFSAPTKWGRGTPKGGGGGDNPTARSSAACPLHHASRGPPPPRCARGRIKEIRSSRRFSRPSPADHHDAKEDTAPPKRERSAERRMSAIAAPSAAARFSYEARPPFGAHACGTRHRLLPRWLSPRTGFPAKRALPGVLPPWPKCLRLSTLRADRSFCRSTGDPGPPGSGSANPRAGAAPRSAFQACPSGKAPSVSEIGVR